MLQMSNFYLRSFFGILLENDPAPMQGTAKAILLRPRPPPEPTATIGTGRGQDPKAPTSTASRSDLAGTLLHPKRAKGRGQTPPGAKNFTGQKSGREKREEDGEEEAREERKEKTGA